MRQEPPSGPGPHFRGFTITLRHTTIGRTPLDEWSARRTDLYLTTHNTHKIQTSMTPAGFEPAIPASERPQTHVLRGAAIGIGSVYTGSWNSTQNRYLTNLHKLFRLDKLDLNLLFLMITKKYVIPSVPVFLCYQLTYVRKKTNG